MGDEHLAWIREDVDAMMALAERVDPSTMVPSCPAWTYADLLGHLGRGFGGWWTVCLRSTPDSVIYAINFAQYGDPPPDDPAQVAHCLRANADAWLAEADTTAAS